MTSELSKLPNIGPKIAEELVKAGINCPKDLCELGSVEALLKINGTQFDESCLNKLYALEGAIRGIRWHGLDLETKKTIKNAYYTKIGRAE